MQNEKNFVENDEISLKDIVNFFKDNVRLIALTTTLGFLLAIAYVKLAPKKYEAGLMLQMAQFGANISNIENPATLAERLRYPAIYSASVLKECGYADAESVGAYLGGMLKTKVSKVIPNVLEIRIRASTPELAQRCAESLVPMIEQQQRALIEERLLGKKEQLLGYQQSMFDELRQLESIRKSETASFGYLAKLDKLSWLRTRVDALQEETLLAYQHPAKLVMPISASGNPVSPKVLLSLLLGLVIGSILGVSLALAKKVWRKVNE